MPTQLSLSDLQPLSLKGKSVLITGGALGAGHHTATFLAKSGAYVTIADIQPSEPVVESFKAKSLAIQYVQCDVTDWSQQVVAFKQAINFAPSRSLDIVCCFAAVDRPVNLVEQAKQTEPALNDEPQPPDTVEFDINLKGTLYTTKLALHYLRLPGRPGKKARKPLPVRSISSSGSDSDTRDHGKGVDVESSGLAEPALSLATKSLIIVSSLSGYVCSPSHATYTVSQFGNRGLFGAISIQARKELNIQCNLIVPWPNISSGVEVSPQKPEGEAVKESGADPESKEADIIESLDNTEIAKPEDTRDAIVDEAVRTTDVPDQDVVTKAEDEDKHAVTEPATEAPTEGSVVITESETADTSQSAHAETKSEEQHESVPEISQATSEESKSARPIKAEDSPSAKMEDITNTIAKCCTDTSLSGRAFAIMPEGVFDLGDDLEGGHSGHAIAELMATRRAARDTSTTD